MMMMVIMMMMMMVMVTVMMMMIMITMMMMMEQRGCENVSHGTANGVGAKAPNGSRAANGGPGSPAPRMDGRRASPAARMEGGGSRVPPREWTGRAESRREWKGAGGRTGGWSP